MTFKAAMFDEGSIGVRLSYLLGSSATIKYNEVITLIRNSHRPPLVVDVFFIKAHAALVQALLHNTGFNIMSHFTFVHPETLY